MSYFKAPIVPQAETLKPWLCHGNTGSQLSRKLFKSVAGCWLSGLGLEAWSGDVWKVSMILAWLSSVYSVHTALGPAGYFHRETPLWDARLLFLHAWDKRDEEASASRENDLRPHVCVSCWPEVSLKVSRHGLASTFTFWKTYWLRRFYINTSNRHITSQPMPIILAYSVIIHPATPHQTKRAILRSPAWQLLVHGKPQALH